MYKVGERFDVPSSGYKVWVERTGHEVGEHGELAGRERVAMVTLGRGVQNVVTYGTRSLEAWAGWLYEELGKVAITDVVEVRVGEDELEVGGYRRGGLYWSSRMTHFSASHEQWQLPESYPCHRLHGHNYVVNVVVSCDELRNGQVVDEKVFQDFMQVVAERVDHRHLNDVVGDWTSTEHVAGWLGRCLMLGYERHLEALEVGETPKIWATWWGGERYGVSKLFSFSAVRDEEYRVGGWGESVGKHRDKYKVRVQLRRTGLDEYGFAFDLAKLVPFGAVVSKELHNSNLNVRMGGDASLECVAKWLYGRAKEWCGEYLYSIRISDNERRWAEYYED